MDVTTVKNFVVMIHMLSEVGGGSMLASTHSLGWGGIVELGGGFWRYRTVIRHAGHGL